MITLAGDRQPETAPRVVTEIAGGQGTINVNSCSPDSRRFAFVTYEPLARR
jgi:hypothetical protein